MGSRIPFKFGTANLARLVLSLIIAFALWAFVTNERDPDSSQTFTNLQIEGTETLGGDFQLVNSLPTVSVTVKGPESVIQNISSASLSPSVDLSGVSEAGDHEISVNVVTPDGLRSVEVDPETITVSIGNVVSRVMQVTVVEPPNPPATLTSITLSTSQVRLIGTERNVERVESVEVSVVLSGRTESFSTPARPIPWDANRVDLSDLVRVEPTSVQVTVEFEVRSLSVPVVVRCACQNDAGQLEIRDLPTAIAIPSTVRIEGPSQLITLVSEVFTLPINIDAMEISGFVPNGAELDDSNLPDGVTLERQSIDVYVEIEQQVQSFQQEVIAINIPEHAQIEISPSTVSFDIQTTEELLALMENEPPVVIVDLEGLEAGTHILTPRIILPADARVINLRPTDVTVSIEIAPPTPTPEPTATPTPEPTLAPSSIQMQIPTPEADE